MSFALTSAIARAASNSLPLIDHRVSEWLESALVNTKLRLSVTPVGTIAEISANRSGTLLSSLTLRTTMNCRTDRSAKGAFWSSNVTVVLRGYAEKSTITSTRSAIASGIACSTTGSRQQAAVGGDLYKRLTGTKGQSERSRIRCIQDSKAMPACGNDCASLNTARNGKLSQLIALRSTNCGLG